MAKGQLRSNKEPRKPKKDKAAKPAAGSVLGSAPSGKAGQATTQGKPKR